MRLCWNDGGKSPLPAQVPKPKNKHFPRIHPPMSQLRSPSSQCLTIVRPRSCFEGYPFQKETPLSPRGVFMQRPVFLVNIFVLHNSCTLLACLFLFCRSCLCFTLMYSSRLRLSTICLVHLVIENIKYCLSSLGMCRHACSSIGIFVKRLAVDRIIEVFVQPFGRKQW